MKFFKTVTGCFNYIKRHSNTGKEKTINDCIMFGMGIYAWSDVVTFSKVSDQSNTSNATYHFKDDAEIIKFISYLKNSDGYLAVM